MRGSMTGRARIAGTLSEACVCLMLLRVSSVLLLLSFSIAHPSLHTRDVRDTIGTAHG